MFPNLSTTISPEKAIARQAMVATVGALSFDELRANAAAHQCIIRIADLKEKATAKISKKTEKAASKIAKANKDVEKAVKKTAKKLNSAVVKSISATNTTAELIPGVFNEAGLFTNLVEHFRSTNAALATETNSTQPDHELANRCEALVGEMTGFTEEQVLLLRLASSNFALTEAQEKVLNVLYANPNYVALRKELMTTDWKPIDKSSSGEAYSFDQLKAGATEVTSEITSMTLSSIDVDTGETKELLHIDHANDNQPTQDVSGAVAKAAAANPELANSALGNALINSKRGDTSNNRRARIQHVPTKSK